MRKMISLILAALFLYSYYAVAEENSLWGRQVKAQMISLPDAAVADGLQAPFIAGMSADGQKLLVIGFNGAPYLWDAESGERTYLTAGDATTDAVLDLCARSEKMPEEQNQALSEQYAGAPGDPRLATVMDESFFRAARATVSMGAWDDYLVVSNMKLNFTVLLDCRTGEMRMPEQGTPMMPVVDGKMVAAMAPRAFLWEVETGVETELDFGKKGWSVQAARLLPDGSVCGILEDRTVMDKRNGQETVMVILAADGTVEEYPLGNYVLGHAPTTLLSDGESRHVVAFNSMAVSKERPLIIDRDQSAVSVLVRNPAGGVVEEPLSGCLDENNKVNTDGLQYADIAIIPMAEMKGGTILTLDMSCNELLLVNPTTLETWTLLDDSGMADLGQYRMAFLGSMPPLTGNGFDSFVLRSQDVYLKLAE